MRRKATIVERDRLLWFSRLGRGVMSALSNAAAVDGDQRRRGRGRSGGTTATLVATRRLSLLPLTAPRSQPQLAQLRATHIVFRPTRTLSLPSAHPQHPSPTRTSPPHPHHPPISRLLLLPALLALRSLTPSPTPSERMPRPAVPSTDYDHGGHGAHHSQHPPPPDPERERGRAVHPEVLKSVCTTLLPSPSHPLTVDSTHSLIFPSPTRSPSSPEPRSPSSFFPVDTQGALGLRVARYDHQDMGTHVPCESRNRDDPPSAHLRRRRRRRPQGEESQSQ